MHYCSKVFTVFISVGDPDPVGSGNYYYQSEKVIFRIKIFSTLAFQQIIKKTSELLVIW
jgi:hypothetical protein